MTVGILHPFIHFFARDASFFSFHFFSCQCDCRVDFYFAVMRVFSHDAFRREPLVPFHIFEGSVSCSRNFLAMQGAVPLVMQRLVAHSAV